jgi:mannan endo-1,4-beta-mannosidase
MVDKNATTETAALFYNLRNSGKTKIIIGQQDAFNSFYETWFFGY